MQNLNIKEWLQQGEKEFEEKFCSIYDTPVFVDNGILTKTYPLLNTKNGNDIKQFISSRQISLIKMIVEDGEYYVNDYKQQGMSTEARVLEQFISLIKQDNGN